jgi:hypothetical protein
MSVFRASKGDDKRRLSAGSYMKLKWLLLNFAQPKGLAFSLLEPPRLNHACCM